MLCKVCKQLLLSSEIACFGEVCEDCFSLRSVGLPGCNSCHTVVSGGERKRGMLEERTIEEMATCLQ